MKIFWHKLHQIYVAATMEDMEVQNDPPIEVIPDSEPMEGKGS